MDAYRFSVALASYNGEKYIKEQIESILNQTYPIYEVIVSDDESTDGTLDVIGTINDPRIKVFHHSSHNGFAGNFENALKQKGPSMIECFIDEDDKVFPMVSPGGNISEAFDESDLKKKKS